MISAGTGSPTIVLEAGLGDTAESWGRVFPAIANFSRVVAYDRAGSGGSDAGPGPRSYAQIANELHTALQRAGIPPPYVLVGHSLGGALIRGYQHLFPAEVVGMVFVDPVTESLGDDAARWAAMKQAQSAMSAHGSEAERGETEFLIDDCDRHCAILRKLVPSTELPLTLLVARRNRPPGWEQSVAAIYEPWIMASQFGRMTVTPDSGHYIQNDQPELVIESIRRTAFPDALTVLSKVIAEQGVERAMQRYHEMKQRYPADLLNERTLNVLGYLQLYNQGTSSAGVKNAEGAIRIFSVNAEEYPQSANVYDSLAEAYMVAGKREDALKNYHKSLAINPKNQNAGERISELETSNKH
jgi:pimeloyl-ACP methyl ester carboxylesterase